MVTQSTCATASGESGSAQPLLLPDFDDNVTKKADDPIGCNW